MRHLGLFSYLCLTATTAAAAPGADPGYPRQHAETRGFMLGRPMRPRPTPDGKAVIFLRGGPRSPELRLYEFDVDSAKARELVTPEQVLGGRSEELSAEEKAHRERMRVSMRGFTSFDLSHDGSLVLVALSGRLYTIRRADAHVTELGTGHSPAMDPQFSPDGKHVAYVRERDLYVLDLATQKETRLTESHHPLVTNGLAEFVAQEEMGRFSGFCWSPDSRTLVYEEADSRGLETFHIADPAHPEAEPHASPYPRPGKQNARVRLAMLPVGGGKPTWVQWDEGRFPYLATFRWPEGGPLTVVVEARDQRDLEVLQADRKSGKTARLLTEHDDAWLDLDQEVPRWLRDGSGFLWTTERNGGKELELRAPGGDLVRTLVPRDAGYWGLLDVNERARTAVVLASSDPAQRHLYQVSLDGGPLAPLGEQREGMYHAVFSKDHGLYVQTVSSLQEMPRSTVHRADGTTAGELPSVAEEPPWRPRTELTRAGEHGFRAALTRPRDFTAGRKYPVIVHVYGGPHSLMVVEHMSGSSMSFLFDQWLADHGYVVVRIDGRGTPGRGRPWERAILGNFAEVPLGDQVAGLQDLGRRYPELDLLRVGVFGWSFGGYMAALAVLKRPDVYHAGVAGAPVVDWRDYDTFYTERYLGMPEENAKGYEGSSLLPLAAGLRRPLLLVHGTADDNVYFFHSLKLSQALFRAGKPHEFLPLVGLTHMVPDPLVLERLWGRIAGHFAAVLRP